MNDMRKLMEAVRPSKKRKAGTAAMAAREEIANLLEVINELMYDADLGTDVHHALMTLEEKVQNSLFESEESEEEPLEEVEEDDEEALEESEESEEDEDDEKDLSWKEKFAKEKGEDKK